MRSVSLQDPGFRVPFLAFVSGVATCAGACDSTAHAVRTERAPAIAAAEDLPAPRSSASRIESDIRKLASFGTRHTLSATDDPARGIGAARRWLLEELTRINDEHHGGRMKVSFDEHTLEPSARLPQGGEVWNVVAILEGSEPGRLVAVSGHYDSRCSDPLDATSDAPGANDDASGTALVLECARRLAGARPRASVAFVCVAGEEQGLHGSRALCERWISEGRGLEAFLTCDIVGGARGSNGLLEPDRVRLFSDGIPAERAKAVGSDNDSSSRQLARYLEEVGERALPGFDVELIFRGDRFLRGGDHRPFHERGLAAVRFTEPNENFAQQHQDVRVEGGLQYGDLPEFVDFDYVARVTDVCAAGLAALGSAPPPPADVRMKTRVLSPDTELAWTPVAGAAGYRVRARRTWQPTWTETIELGTDAARSGTALLRGWSKDDWYFALEAYGTDGASSLPVYPASDNR
jgi:acetylornithine deacetylase/succinyl-diaminopimelate desuccinylase-like protein